MSARSGEGLLDQGRVVAECTSSHAAGKLPRRTCTSTVPPPVATPASCINAGYYCLITKCLVADAWLLMPHTLSATRRVSWRRRTCVAVWSA